MARNIKVKNQKMAAKDAGDFNLFSKIWRKIRTFDDLGLLDDELDALTGTFKLARKTNKKGTSWVKSAFVFYGDIARGRGPKVTLRDRDANSLFGDSYNPRKVRSGNKKLDYRTGAYYFEDGSQKLVELSVEQKFVKDFEDFKKVKGFFRASLDDNFISMSKGKSDEFTDKKIMTADFEIPFIQLSEI